MLEEHDCVVLTDDLGESNLKPGDVGTIVHVYSDRSAFEVEFTELDGHGVALATVQPSQLRPMAATDLAHARKFGMRDQATESRPGARRTISAGREAPR